SPRRVPLLYPTRYLFVTFATGGAIEQQSTLRPQKLGSPESKRTARREGRTGFDYQCRPSAPASLIQGGQAPLWCGEVHSTETEWWVLKWVARRSVARWLAAR